jgi:hypothetical protein
MGWYLPPPELPDSASLLNYGNPSVPAANAGSFRGSSGYAAAHMCTALKIKSGGRGTTSPPLFFLEGVHPPHLYGVGWGVPPLSDTSHGMRFFRFSDGKCPKERTGSKGGWSPLMLREQGPPSPLRLFLGVAPPNHPHVLLHNTQIAL